MELAKEDLQEANKEMQGIEDGVELDYLQPWDTKFLSFEVHQVPLFLIRISLSSYFQTFFIFF